MRKQLRPSRADGIEANREAAGADRTAGEEPGHAFLAGRYAVLLACAALVVAIDQIVKGVVTATLKNGRVVELLGGLVRFDYTRNSGAAFGMFRSGGALFVAVAIAVSVAILVYFRKVAESQLIVRLGLGLILGGAMGNLIDRVRLGYVVDFVDLRWWYVFNVSDSAIVVGVTLLILFAGLDVRDSR